MKFIVLEPSDLVDIILNKLRRVEFHVPVDCSLAKHFVMIVVFIITGLYIQILIQIIQKDFNPDFYLKHNKVFSLFGGQFGVVSFLNGEFWNVVVDSLLAGWSTLQESKQKIDYIIFKNICIYLILLYGVLTLSMGEWGWRLLDTMFFIRLQRAIAVEILFYTLGGIKLK